MRKRHDPTKCCQRGADGDRSASLVWRGGELTQGGLLSKTTLGMTWTGKNVNTPTHTVVLEGARGGMGRPAQSRINIKYSPSPIPAPMYNLTSQAVSRDPFRCGPEGYCRNNHWMCPEPSFRERYRVRLAGSNPPHRWSSRSRPNIYVQEFTPGCKEVLRTPALQGVI